MYTFPFFLLFTDLSTGLLTFAQFGHRDSTDAKVGTDCGGFFIQVEQLYFNDCTYVVVYTSPKHLHYCFISVLQEL